MHVHSCSGGATIVSLKGLTENKPNLQKNAKVGVIFVVFGTKSGRASKISYDVSCSVSMLEGVLDCSSVAT